MTREEFDAALERLDLSQTQFAAMTGYGRQAVYGWGKERTTGPQRRTLQEVPTWVPVLLDAWTLSPRSLHAALKRTRSA